MSFVLTYKDLSNQNFIKAMRKLCGSDKFKDIKKAYNIGRIGSLLEIELKTYNDLMAKMRKKFKEFLPKNEEEPTPEDLKHLEAMKAETEKFLEISFTLERHKLEFSELEGLDLTPNEICALAPLINGDPDAEEKKPDLKVVEDVPKK